MRLGCLGAGGWVVGVALTGAGCGSSGGCVAGCCPPEADRHREQHKEAVCRCLPGSISVTSGVNLT